MKGFGDNNKSKIKGNGTIQSNLNKEEILNKAFQFHSRGNVAEAIKYYEFFINQGFKDHRVFLNCGEILKDLGKLKEAEIWIRRAIELKPNYALAYNNLGTILISLNKLKEAESCFHKVITINPNLTASYFNLANLPYSEVNKVWQRKLFSESFLKNKSKNDQLNIYFARSHILHKQNSYKESAKYLTLANQLKISLYPSNSEAIINKSELLLVESDQMSFIRKKEKKYPQNIFIVGMPRSGSTLIESIISMNNKVIDLGEVNILERSFKKWKKNKMINDLVDFYMQTIKKFQSNITTNKYLSNYQYAGIISKYIPNSKIIHCYRNPLDNILSIYRANFTKGNEYSSSLIDTAKVYLNQEKIMNEYKKRFKAKIYDIDYDSLVTNPYKEIKSLISWLGWNWEDQYLSPHLNPRSVLTASNVQVRSPINSKSIKGWKNYKEMLKPAIEIITQDKKYKDLKY